MTPRGKQSKTKRTVEALNLVTPPRVPTQNETNRTGPKFGDTTWEAIQNETNRRSPDFGDTTSGPPQNEMSRTGPKFGDTTSGANAKLNKPYKP